jgi:hypothetical protein
LQPERDGRVRSSAWILIMASASGGGGVPS